MRTQNNSKTSISQNVTLPSKAQNARGGRYHNTLNIGLSQCLKIVLLYLSFVIFFLLNSKSVYADTFNADSFKKFNTASVSDNIIGKTGDQYKLTVEKGSNIQSVTGAGWYDKGTVVTASGIAKATYTDTGTTYTVDPNDSGHRYYAKHTFNVVPVNKTMDSAQTATINATESKSNGGGDQYYLKVTAGTNIKSVSNVNGWKNKGSKVSISATPKDTTGYYYTNNTTTDDGKGYRYKKSYSFEKWSDNNTNNTRELTMNSPFTLSAQGKEEKTGEQYYLTITKDSNVQSATNSQWVNKGNSVNVTATAQSGYKITGGTGSTDAMNATKTVNVTSAINGYTLTWSSTLSKCGGYLGATMKGTQVNKGNKVIVYTNANGVTSYANPYEAGNITIKAGTAVILRMVSGYSYSRGGHSVSCISWTVGSSQINRKNGTSYSLISSSYTPTASGTLSIYNDGYDDKDDNYYWSVKFS